MRYQLQKHQLPAQAYNELYQLSTLWAARSLKEYEVEEGADVGAALELVEQQVHAEQVDLVGGQRGHGG